MLIAAVILMNIVVAVLLDEFITAVARYEASASSSTGIHAQLSMFSSSSFVAMTVAVAVTEAEALVVAMAVSWVRLWVRLEEERKEIL